MDSSWGSLGAQCEGLLALCPRPASRARLRPAATHPSWSRGPQLKIRMGRPIFNRSKDHTVKQVMKSTCINVERRTQDVWLNHKSRLHVITYNVILLCYYEEVFVHTRKYGQRDCEYQFSLGVKV